MEKKWWILILVLFLIIGFVAGFFIGKAVASKKNDTLYGSPRGFEGVTSPFGDGVIGGYDFAEEGVSDYTWKVEGGDW